MKNSNVVSSFIVCSNQSRSALVCDLLSYNALFVSQLYEYKSLVLLAHDLIFHTSLLELIYFLNKNLIYLAVEGKNTIIKFVT